MPPRTLKAHVGVWFSCFTHTSQPVRLARSGQAYCGVGGTIRCTSWAAASNSARVKSGLGASIKSLRARRKTILARSLSSRFHVLDLHCRDLIVDDRSNWLVAKFLGPST